MAKINPDTVIGRKLSFYNVKTGRKASLPVEQVKRYSLAKGSNKNRSKGRVSVMAIAKQGRTKLYRVIANIKARKSHRKSKSKKSKKSRH